MLLDAANQSIGFVHAKRQGVGVLLEFQFGLARFQSLKLVRTGALAEQLGAGFHFLLLDYDLQLIYHTQAEDICLFEVIVWLCRSC